MEAAKIVANGVTVDGGDVGFLIVIKVSYLDWRYFNLVQQVNARLFGQRLCADEAFLLSDNNTLISYNTLMNTRLLSSLIFLCAFTSAFALRFPMPPAGVQVVGQVQQIMSQPNETLAQIAERFDVGYFEMLEANPLATKEGELAVGTELTIPTSYVLPDTKHEGIVINLAELRLYHYMPDKGVLDTEPIGIGREGWETPQGVTRIVDRRKDPTWYAPLSIIKARAAEGVTIPRVIKPGPDNPLGQYALRLGWRTYLIHGTNDPEGVGRRVSSGCIRMYNKDIQRLYETTPVNTPVRVINQAYKAGWGADGQLYVESHLPLQEDRYEQQHHYRGMLKALVATTVDRPANIDWARVRQIATQLTGIPTAVGVSSKKEI